MSEHTYEFINEIDLTKLESEETRAMSKEEQQYLETKEALWSIEKQLVEVTSSLCKMTDAINNIIYK